MTYIEDNQRIRVEFNYLEELEPADFIWEFIRRSDEYRKTCETYLNNQPSGNEEDLFRPFGLSCYIDHNLKSVDKDRKTGVLPRESFLWYWDSVSACFAEPFTHGNLTIWNFYHPTNIPVWIDLTAGKDKITESLSAIINAARAREEVPLLKRDHRFMLKEWGDYLIAYDLYGRGSLTIRQIADIVYNPQGDHAKDDPGHTSECLLCKQTRNGIDRAEALIGGEYKNFIFSDVPLMELMDEHYKNLGWDILTERLRFACGNDPEALRKFLVSLGKLIDEHSTSFTWDILTEWLQKTCGNDPNILLKFLDKAFTVERSISENDDQSSGSNVSTFF